MGYGVAFLVFLSVSAAVFSKTIYDEFKEEEEKEDDNYDLILGFSENYTNETEPATPAPQLPLAINVRTPPCFLGTVHMHWYRSVVYCSQSARTENWRSLTGWTFCVWEYVRNLIQNQKVGVALN